jgi:hypothetical protein
MPYDVVASNRQAVQSGLALGRTMFDNAMRMQELKSQQAYRQLQERQLAQTLAVQMEQHDLEVQRRADMTKAWTRVMADTAPTFEMPVDGPPTADGTAPGIALVPNPQAMALEDAMGKHVLPVIAQYDKTGREAFDALAGIAKMKQDREQALHQPGFEVAKDPRTGREYSVFRSSRNSSQLVHQPEITSLTDPNTGKPVSVIQTGNSIQKVGQDIEGRMLRVDDIKKLKDAPGGAQLLEWDDAKGAFVLPAKNADAARKVLTDAHGITTGTRTALEATGESAEGLAETGRKLLPLINERTVGVRGELTRLAQRTGLSMVVPGLENPEVAEADAYGRAFTAKVIRSLRSDGNINKDEVTRLESASNTISWTTPNEAKARLAAFLDQSAVLARRSYSKLGKPPKDEFLTRDQIRDRVVSGELTAAEGAALYTKTIDSFVQSIRKEIGR